jgi:hypothetical protein
MIYKTALANSVARLSRSIMVAQPAWEVDLLVFHVSYDDTAYEIINKTIVIAILLELLLKNKQQMRQETNEINRSTCFQGDQKNYYA